MSVGSLPWMFRSRSLLFHPCPHLPPHGNIITDALLKGTIFLPLPFPVASSAGAQGLGGVSAEGNREGGNGKELSE